MRPAEIGYARRAVIALSPVKPLKTNTRQEEVSQAIKDYTVGRTTVSDFKMSLQRRNVNIDEKLERLIQRHEVGDTVSFSQFGSLIFRKLNGQELYANNTKINLNSNEVSMPSTFQQSFQGTD